MTNKINLTAIIAIDFNLGIGFKDRILFHNKMDMFIFKTYTEIVKNCLAGRVTYNTLPTSLFKTRDVTQLSRNSEVGVSSLDVLPFNNYVVIGGSQIYKAYFESISTWVITTHKARAIDVDSWFDKEIYDHIVNSYSMVTLYEDDEIIVNVYIKQ